MIAWAALLIAAVTAAPEARDWPDAGGFEIVQLEGGCALTAQYPLPGRSPLTLAVFDGTSPELVMSSADWSNKEGEKYALSFLLGDHAYTGEVTGQATATEKGFTAAVDDSFINAFAAAPSMFVSRGDVVVAHLNLRGTAAAVAGVRRCSAYVERETAAQTARERRIDYIAADPFASTTSAPPEPSPIATRPPVITNPTWNRRPAGDFPGDAQARNIRSGAVQMECTANLNGSLSACAVISEVPSNVGFGAAALDGARRAQLTPRSVDGVAPGGKVRFVTRFALD